MFKPGEKAIYQKREVTVVTTMDSRIHGWRVLTEEEGALEESDLTPADPNVLSNASGVEPEPYSLRPQSRMNLDEDQEEARDQAIEVLRKIPVDFRGHHYRKPEVLDDSDELVSAHLFQSSPQETNAILKGEGWVTLPSIMIRYHMHTCPACGESITAETNGQVIRCVSSCKQPNGPPPVEWELNVPSGRMVVANDLRSLFPVLEEYNVDNCSGIKNTSLEYAQWGLAHGFLGNTSPRVYQVEEGSYKVASTVWDEDDKDPLETSKVASICTDLWWYSICDFSEFKLRLEHFKAKQKDYRVEVIDVKPGVYRFTQYGPPRGEDDNESKEHTYTTFEWVRGPDTKKDYIKQYLDVNVTPIAFAKARVKKWPILYRSNRDQVTGDVILDSWERVALDLFCRYGTDINWHEKGFPVVRTEEEDTLNEEVPSFRSQCYWGNPSARYSSLFTQETLSPPFAKFAFRVLESIISFGMRVNSDRKCRRVAEAREVMLLAVQRYRILAARYPEEADLDYVSWLSEEGRAEAWVERFPLGPIFTKRHQEDMQAQRWIPEGTYAILFDARKMEGGGHFSNGTSWASRETATGWAARHWEDNGNSDQLFNCCWLSHAGTTIPLYSVARVVQLGQVSHTGDLIVELAYDYGTPWMRSSMRKGLPEHDIRKAARALSKEEYESLLPGAKKFFKGKGKTSQG